ncbi:hypothetical protein RJT34_19438 [Clitoria ternatea]|uniref:Glutaredoxin domain-containing protein n=1 Tax=Clitoria ternatea TaxID=43366 RepID=A0AAN9P3G0_CLITE
MQLTSPTQTVQPKSSIHSNQTQLLEEYQKKMDVLTTLTADRPVVIFSKSTCSMTHTVKALICSFGANPAVIDVDKMPSGQQVERALLQLGCRPSVPAVFIGQQFIGGADQVISLNVQNKLVQLLLRARAIFV